MINCGHTNLIILKLIRNVIKYPLEFLNSLDFPGLFAVSQSSIKSQIGFYNVAKYQPTKSFCNGLRLAMKKLLNNMIEATILKKKYEEEIFLITRIQIISTDLPFKFKQL